MADEVYLLCRPDPELGENLERQTEDVYARIGALLHAEGASPRDVIRETVYFRDIFRDGAAFRAARERIFALASGESRFCPASTLIEQPPLDERHRIEVAAAVLLHRDGALDIDRYVPGPSGCSCELCAEVPVRALRIGEQEVLHVGALHGSPGPAEDEAYSMFRSAAMVLAEQGMRFQDVARTWIYLRDMERDYDALNRARRRFFEEAGLTLRPASTGISGAPLPDGHNLAMALYAIKRPGSSPMALMHTPTLNEAWTYGSDFSRGMRIAETNKTALYVSGTASIDEAGHTVHVEDLDGQVQRMLLNISTLLAAQGASFADVLWGTTYLKRTADARRLRELLRESRIATFPNALVEASVCRPDLLCEMEVVAARPPA